MSAVSGIMVGGSKIVIAAQGCKVCGVELSERWFEQKLPIIIAGKRHTMMVLICAGCAPHVPSAAGNSEIRNPKSEIEVPVEAGGL